MKVLGRLQKGSTSSLEFFHYGFAGGLNLRSAPQLIGDDDLTIATNVYLRPDGAAQLRNGMALYGNSQAGSSATYLARWYQDVKNGVVQTPETVKLLAQFSGTLYSVPSSGAWVPIGSIGGGTALPMTTARIQDPNDPNFTSGLTDVMVICTGSGGPYVYDGVNLYTPAGWSAAAGAQFCAIVNGILWFGGIPKTPNQIFGTGDGIIASMETLPAYRNFVLSSPVAGLCASGTGATATLIIGRTTGISTLYGTGPSTFYLQDVPFQDGVTAGRTMISSEGVCYFQGHMAYYAFDGQTEPQPISRKIEPWILNDQFTPGYPMTQRWDLSWAQVYNNRLHLGYCSNSTTPNVILCYDLIVKGWTVLVPTPGIASMILLDAPSDGSPYTCLVGSATTGQVYTWDYVSAVTSATVLDDATAVLAQVQSKYFKIGVPGTNKALQRFYPEFQVAGAFSAPFTISTDYGLSTTQALTTNPTVATNTLVWDQGFWDQMVWGGLTGFVPFGSPMSRIDLPGVQGESFAFGISMTQALAPWIWSGGSGVYQQQGRT
ncbi:MAG: hypothetical protein JWO85_2666 [Candidatus Eremiobacteraeota bacterium]|nr:hypothetical protein [Candidatus Eremiobacteraeota bacterium]